jgi:hypothetical protein
LDWGLNHLITLLSFSFHNIFISNRSICVPSKAVQYDSKTFGHHIQFVEVIGPVVCHQIEPISRWWILPPLNEYS